MGAYFNVMFYIVLQSNYKYCFVVTGGLKVAVLPSEVSNNGFAKKDSVPATVASKSCITRL